MDSNDDVRPVMTNLEGDQPKQDTAPLQPWLRRFASVVGFAAMGSSDGNPATLG